MNKTNKLTVSALFFSIGLILPFFTGQIPAIGKMLCPMHFPVLLCGLIAGWQYGLIVGFFLPLARSFLFGVPVLFPGGIAMAFELATYGLVIGYLYEHSRWQCVKALYRCLLTAMVAGRLVWGAARVLLLGIGGGTFTWELFLSGALLNAIPGIILQLILVPAIMVSLNRAKIIPFKKIPSINNICQ
ncbi:MAG: ECF transporter S component [Lachnospiraceae bacterium]|nr:ECF transporter S component [Lachnospiraceae bacterium]